MYRSRMITKRPREHSDSALATPALLRWQPLIVPAPFFPAEAKNHGKQGVCVVITGGASHPQEQLEFRSGPGR